MGVAEAICAYLLFTYGNRASGAFLGLIIMAFAVTSHRLLGDPLKEYAVPLVAGIACFYIYAVREVIIVKED